MNLLSLPPEGQLSVVSLNVRALAQGPCCSPPRKGCPAPRSDTADSIPTVRTGTAGSTLQGGSGTVLHSACSALSVGVLHAAQHLVSGGENTANPPRGR